jgi:hypothetical protein
MYIVYIIIYIIYIRHIYIVYVGNWERCTTDIVLLVWCGGSKKCLQNLHLQRGGAVG